MIIHRKHLMIIAAFGMIAVRIIISASAGFNRNRRLIKPLFYLLHNRAFFDTQNSFFYFNPSNNSFS